MKLSLNWIFDHIKANIKDFDIDRLLAQFSATTAEIENVEKIDINLEAITIVKILEVNNTIRAESSELGKKFELPSRPDAIKNKLYLVIKENKNYRWANITDFAGNKEGIMPAIFCDEKELSGSWKKSIENSDYILEIDNKAVTNRPDLWGHRGFAREIAAIIKKPLVAEENILEPKPIKHYTHGSQPNGSNIIGIEIAQDQKNCSNAAKRLAGIYIEQIDNKDSILPIAIRLAKIDSRPINTIVDLTNYIMFDIGQPMHAFDASKIENNKIIARCATQGEELTLLDGEKIKLNTCDVVISDGSKAIALAGIMGGESTAVNNKTNSVFLESANFDAATIRRTAAAIKKRTEASARFEKTLDPNQNTNAILRYLKILSCYNINYKAADAVISVGPLAQEGVIVVKHEIILARIGISIDQGQIEEILTKLGFGFQATYENDQVIYKIIVPTYRASKDILYSEDIVEEIARFIGYSSVVAQAPIKHMTSFDTRAIMRTRDIKHELAFGLNMNEVQTYSFFDEEFLKLINYEPIDTLEVASPQSYNYRRLITSLVPNLLKCIHTNYTKEDKLNFFEINRVWFYELKAVESKELSGIFYESKNDVNFYSCKSNLEQFFNSLKINIEWTKPTKELEVWFNPHQTAELLFDGNIIGRAGKANKQFLNLVAPGDAFIFELDAHFLINVPNKIVQYKPIGKYQETYLDISMLVPIITTVRELEEAILNSDKRIISVKLLDVFEKDEWINQKSVTIRFEIYDENKTLTKEEIDAIWKSVIKSLEKYKVVVR